MIYAIAGVLHLGLTLLGWMFVLEFMFGKRLDPMHIGWIGWFLGTINPLESNLDDTEDAEDTEETELEDMGSGSEEQEQEEGDADLAQNKQILFISIDGNIGSGKSTLLAKLQDLLPSHIPSQNVKIKFMREPVQEWESVQCAEGISLLEHFYQEPERYSFLFQIYVYITQIALMRKTLEEVREDIRQNPAHQWVLISERSMHTNRHIFANLLYANGSLSDMEINVYLSWHKQMIRDFPAPIILYLRTPPKVCLERVIQRQRAGECGITLKYLEECHDMHELYIESMVQNTAPYRGIYVDQAGNYVVKEGDAVVHESAHVLNSFEFQEFGKPNALVLDGLMEDDRLFTISISNFIELHRAPQ